VAPLVKGPKREMAASACQSFPFPQALFACQVCRFLREKVSSWHELASPDSSSGLKKDPTLFEEESSSRARKPKLIGVHAEGNLKEKRLAKIVFHLGIRKKSLLADGHVVVETLTHDYTDSDEEESD
jgi:hypothetical protein